MTLVSHATSEQRGENHWLLRFELHLPHAYAALWPALTTPDGLRGWLAAADVLERRLGGAITLRWLNTGTVVTGRVTAWDVERVAEYTVTEHGRIRFHLEPVGTDSTVIRFVNERRGPRRSAWTAWPAGTSTSSCWTPPWPADRRTGPPGRTPAGRRCARPTPPSPARR